MYCQSKPVIWDKVCAWYPSYDIFRHKQEKVFVIILEGFDEILEILSISRSQWGHSWCAALLAISDMLYDQFYYKLYLILVHIRSYGHNSKLLWWLIFIFCCVSIVCCLLNIFLGGGHYLCFPNLWFPNSVLFVANNVLRVSKDHESLCPIPKILVLQNLTGCLNDHCNRLLYLYSLGSHRHW